MLVSNGVTSVTEGANMPTTLEATKYLQENGVLFVGGKAANADVYKRQTGYGLLYLTNALWKDHGMSLEGKTAAVSGSGNVAIYAIEKAQQLGVKVVTCSDSTGWIYDPEGIDVALLKEVKEAVSYTHLADRCGRNPWKR